MLVNTVASCTNVGLKLTLQDNMTNFASAVVSIQDDRFN